MSMKALLVIDMINDFVKKGGALDCGVPDFDPPVHRFALRRMEKTYGATIA